MIHSLIHPRGLIHKRGLQNPFLPGPSGPTTLAALLFGSPVVQAFPTTAAGLASALGDAAATPSYIWDCQESSGNLIDSITSEALAPANSPLQGQTAVGLGSTRMGDNAVEFLEGSSADFNISGTGTLDVGLSNSVAHIAFIRVEEAVSSRRYICNKSSGAAGYYASLETNGRFNVHTSDNIVGKAAAVTTGDIDDGAWHTVAIVINRTTNMLYAITETGIASIDISAQVSLSNAVAFALGSRTTLDSFPGQIRYHAAFEGAAAEAIDLTAVQAFHTHASDPTGLLTTQTRGSVVSCPVADGYVAHYADDTIPTAWHSGFSDTDKLGLLTNSALTNLLKWSEDFTNAVWTKTTMTVTANNIDSPDGFRSADKLTAGANDDYIAQVFTTTAATQYTLSYWPREETVGATGRLIFYDETGAVELASQVFTCDGTWEQRINITATTNALQVSSSFRVEIDTSGESINAWGTQVTLGNGVHAYIRTTGSTATLAVSDYRAGSLAPATSTAKGEVALEYIRTQYISGTTYVYAASGTGTQNRRYILCDTTTRKRFRVYDGAGTSEDNAFQNVSGIGALQSVRHVWDQSSGGDITGGREQVMVHNGTTYAGGASPWEGSTGSGDDTSTIDIGHASGASQIDAVFQSIISYDDLNGALP